MAIAKVIYSQKVTTKVDQPFNKYERFFVERLLRHAQLDNCNHL